MAPVADTISVSLRVLDGLRGTVNRANAIGAKERRRDALHHRAVFQNIAHATGRAAVVFQHEILPGIIAHGVFDGIQLFVVIPILFRMMGMG